MGFAVFLILFVLMGSASAADDDITALTQDTDNDIDLEKIFTVNDDSNLKETGNTTLKASVSGDTFADVQKAIDSAASGDTIELDGFYNGSGTAIVIDKNNLTIIGNDATLDAQGLSRIFNITGNGVVLKNMNFINGNNADEGGAIYWQGDAGIIDGCNFANNTAKLRGGALYWYGVNGLVSNSNFISNTAKKFSGGAIQWDSNSFNGTVNNCNFTNNTATQKGGAVYSFGVNGMINNSNFINSTSMMGGAIFEDPNAVNSVVNNCNFISNNGGDGGVIYWFAARGIMSNCNFTNNKGTPGGAVNWQRTYGIVKNCNFINNKAKSNGGAVYWEGSNGTVTDCNFTNNTATQNGGAVYWYAYNGTVINSNFDENRAESDGGAVYWDGSNGTVFNSNFDENRAESDGGAIYFNGALTNVNISGNFSKNQALNWGGACYYNGALTNVNIYGNFTNNSAKEQGSAFQFLNSATNVSIIGNFINNTGNHLIYFNGNVINFIIHDSVFINNSDINANVTITNSWFGNNQTNYNIKPNIGNDVNMTDWLFLNTTCDINTTLQVANFIFRLYSYNTAVSEYDGSLMQPISLTLTSQTGRTDKKTVGLNEMLTFTPNDVGTSSLKASFENITEAVEFEFKKQNMTLSVTVNPQTVSYGENINILLNYPNAATGKINITLTGKKYIKTYNNLDLNSIIMLSGSMIPDTYNVSVVYSGNKLFNNATANVTLTVNRQKTIIFAEPVITVYNKDDYLTISLKDKNNNTISGVNLVVDLNGVKNYTTDENGAVKISTKNLTVNTYNVKISFEGNENYTMSNATAEITVNMSSTTISADAVTTAYDVNKNLIISLNDENGNPLVAVPIVVSLSGDKTYFTDENGQVKVNVAKLRPGTYTANIVFAGNEYYAKSIGSANVVVKKAESKITAKKKTFKKSKKIKKYAITLKHNKTPIKKAKVTLKIKKKTYKAKTNSKGKAVFKIKKLNRKGIFKAKIKFKGNVCYDAASKKVKIKIR